MHISIEYIIYIIGFSSFNKHLKNVHEIQFYED